MPYFPPAGAGGGVGISAGTSAVTSGTVVFSNSNGVSFGLNGNTLTASMAGGPGGGGVAISAGTNSTSTGTVFFSNANGVTFGMDTNGAVTGSVVTNYLTTAAQSNQVVNSINGNTGTFSFNAGSSLSSSQVGNAITFGLASNITSALQSTGNYLTTARASNDAIGLNSGLTANGVSMTANSSGLSLNFPAFLTTAMASNRGTDFVQATAGFFGTNASGTIASNGISVSVAAPGGGGTTNQTGPNIAAGTQTATSGTVVFSNSNGFVFGMSNSSVVTASYNDVTESIYWRPNDLITTVGAPINASASIIYAPIDHNLSATRFDLIASINVASAANTSSAGFLYSITAAAYTLNAGTLSSVSSATTNNQMTWGSNVTGSVTGAFFLSVPLSFDGPADKYWFAVQLSTRATGLTGAATTSLANTVSLMGVGSVVAGAFSAREPGANTANSNGWFYGMGMYSGTSNYATIGLSNLTQQGTNMNRANLAFRMRNV